MVLAKCAVFIFNVRLLLHYRGKWMHPHLRVWLGPHMVLFMDSTLSARILIAEGTRG